MNRVAAQIAVFLIQVYRATLSPLLGANCRYTPTCSRYTEEAVRRFGPWRGSWMGLRRIGRCHPWHAAGYDPVPTRPHDAVGGSPSHSESPPTSTDELRSVART